jgi:hypothetical protein
MWCVADLDDSYIAKMEDVLEVYERPYDADRKMLRSETRAWNRGINRARTKDQLALRS